MSTDEISNIAPTPLMQVAATGPELRPYQVEIIRAVEEARAKGRPQRQVLVLPTGSGKTVIAAELVRREIESGGSVLFPAHRIELR